MQQETEKDDLQTVFEHVKRNQERERIQGHGERAVYLLEDDKRVVKSVTWAFDPTALDNRSLLLEARVYERLGSHPDIIAYHGFSAEEGGIILDYAKYQGILDFYREFELPSVHLRFKWLTQVANALYFLHLNGVIHYDLTYGNVLITSTMDAKLADFEGCSVDGAPPLAWSEPPFYPKRSAYDLHTNPKDDIFGFGSLVYTVMLGVEPYDGVSVEELQELYSGESPMLPPIPDCIDPLLGHIIENCWDFAYESMEVVTAELSRITMEIETRPLLGHSDEDDLPEPRAKPWDYRLGTRKGTREEAREALLGRPLA